MARVEGVVAGKAGPLLRLLYMELFARVPRLLFGYGMLTSVIALENLRGRFNLALGIGATGFSEGMVCAIPERPAAARSPGL